MKLSLLLFLSFYTASSFAQMATVDVKLKPAGSFVAKTSDVKGFATQKGTVVEAQNIAVGLKNLKSGIGLRDEHIKKHLEADKYPEAVLVSAKGQNGKGEGLLRIRGIEKKISGIYKIEGNILKADFPIHFSEFNINNIKYMGIGVDDNGMIHVAVPLKK